ncbi:rod shape-determining protein [Fructilactobacillus vespulae]|uniref:rod shape-determining protein n=1 Tax=Fructilactobacillus vespulae TaxID=1249630 RepID=UPI0039B57B51
MSEDIGIDLGTANVLVSVTGKGVVLNEPSVVAVDTKTNKVLAVGKEAYEMVGRTPGNIKAIRPLKDGVISDFDVTESMLTYFIDKLKLKKMVSKPKVMICAPTNITNIERKAIIEAAQKAVGGEVFLEEEPKVAAIGAGMDIFEPTGSMVIDIGGGTSDIAVVSLGDIVTSESLKIAGDVMNHDIVEYLKHNHNIIIGEHTAENIKKEIGTANIDVTDIKEMKVRGRDSVTGMPISVTINNKEIAEALHTTLMIIINGAKRVLETIPPELAADIIDRGVMLTGGGSMLEDLDEVISTNLTVPVIISEDPLENVAKGAGALLDHLSSEAPKKKKFSLFGNND